MHGVTDAAHYAAIASAIREKAGTSSTYTPSEMAPAIAAIEAGGGGGGDVVGLVARTLTEFSSDEVTTVGNYAFYNCFSLASVSIPACTTIGSYAFYNCYHLAAVSLPACTSVGNYAFYNCSALATVSLPVCTTVGSNAFRSCYRLVSLYITSVSSVPALGTYAFGSTPIGGYSVSAGCYGSVYVPTSLVDSFKTATKWSSISSRIVGV